MYKLKQKTQAEIDGQAVDTEMTQRQYNDKYMSRSRDTFWHCDVCNVLFQDDDVIIERTFKSDHAPHCPLIKKLSTKHWWGNIRFWEKRCLNRMRCSDLDYWQKNYHLAPSPHEANGMQ